MKFFGYLLALALMLLGVLFLAASADRDVARRLIIGGLLVAGGIGLILALRLRVPEKRTQLTQQIDLTGGISLEKLTCKNCGATLEKDSVSLREGAIYVTCPYCKTSYQIAEEPKW